MTEWPLCEYPAEMTGVHPDDFFAHAGSPNAQKAQALCMACPLYFPCQDYAREQGIPFGIFGGETAGQRFRWWKKNGGMPSLFTEELNRQAGPTRRREKVA